MATINSYNFFFLFKKTSWLGCKHVTAYCIISVTLQQEGCPETHDGLNMDLSTDALLPPIVRGISYVCKPNVK